jgi:hypothetical protein
MNNFTPPDKSAIREKYKITESDFKILIENDLSFLSKIGGTLEAVASFMGAPTFLLKGGGIVLAVVFLPWWGPNVTHQFTDCLTTTFDFYAKAAEYLKPTDTRDTRLAVVTPQNIAPENNVVDLKLGLFPEGTGIYPISGSVGHGQV